MVILSSKSIVICLEYLEYNLAQRRQRRNVACQLYNMLLLLKCIHLFLTHTHTTNKQTNKTPQHSCSVENILKSWATVGEAEAVSRQCLGLCTCNARSKALAQRGCLPLALKMSCSLPLVWVKHSDQVPRSGIIFYRFLLPGPPSVLSLFFPFVK